MPSSPTPWPRTWPSRIPDRQAILETTAVTERLEKVLGLIDSEISVLQVEKRIRTRVKRQMEKTQRGLGLVILAAIGVLDHFRALSAGWRQDRRSPLCSGRIINAH
jgi:hypothetical protein